MAKSRRFEELDIARALPLLLLPVVHVYEEMESIDSLPESIVTNNEWILTLCTLMPSIFMIFLGANIVFSSRTTAKSLFVRGWKMLGVGLLLDVVRFGIPITSYCIVNQDWTDFFDEFLYYTAVSDIYDFVGLAFLAFALFKKLDLSKMKMFVIAAVLLIADMLIPNFSTGNDFVDAILGCFIWMNEDSCFNFMQWLIFPVIGYIFGDLYKNFATEDDRKCFVKKMLGVSVVGLIGMWFSLASYGIDPLLVITSPMNEYITDIPNVIMLVFEAGIWVALVYFAYMKFKDAKVTRFLVNISKSIMTYYVVQWVIIGWIEYFINGFAPDESFPQFTTLSFWLTIVGTIVLSVVITLAYAKFKENRKAKKLAAQPVAA